MLQQLRTKKKIISLLTISSLLMTLTVGCKKTEEVQDKATINPGGQSTASTANGPEALTLPISKEPITLKYWVSADATVTANLKSYSEIAALAEKEKRTGIKVEYIHPTGKTADAFNLMIASRDLPDMIQYSWYYANIAPDKAISDGIILNLKDQFAKYAPNITKYLAKTPAAKNEITTDEGSMYVFPFLRGDAYLQVFQGPIIRQDWLDSVGLSMPTTIDEWYTALKAFKEKDPNKNGKDDEIPLLLTNTNSPMALLKTSNAFIGAYGIAPGMYHENGVVKYGIVQPQYKEFLTTLRKWYGEKLIDQDYGIITTPLFNSKATSGLAGSLIGNVGGQLGSFTTTMRATNPNVKLAGAPYPTLKKGDKVDFGQFDTLFNGSGTAITTACKNVKEAVKWLDYNYSEEGSLLMNFGVEGTSYNMVNGYPTYSDLINKNPKGLSFTQSLTLNAIPFLGPIIQDKRYMEQSASMPEQKAAINTWMQPIHSKMIPLLSFTADESTKNAKLKADIDTYNDEMFNKFVMGKESLDNFDKYVSTLKGMGVDEMIKIHQSAFDRYNKR
jgi:putative aldouronate transport system substrate-binding protein